MKHPRPRWTVTVWQASWLLPGYSVRVETRSFRWRWAARMYGAVCVPRFLGFRAEIEREAPRLQVIEGGREYRPRGVA